MNKDEILAKSRAENKNKDIYEQEVFKIAKAYAATVLMILATIFFIVQILTGGGINWGIYALPFSGNMTVSWIKYRKLKQKKELPMALLYALFTLALSGCHIYTLVTSQAV